MTLEEIVREELSWLERITKYAWPIITKEKQANLTGQILVLRSILKKAGL